MAVLKRYDGTNWVTVGGKNIVENDNLVNGENTGSLRGINTAEEGMTYSIGYNAVAMGDGTQARGGDSFASGFQTIAAGDGSHAEGIHTYAGDSYSPGSHAEGNGTLALGDYSHSEGGVEWTFPYAATVTAIGISGGYYTISFNNPIIRSSSATASLPSDLNYYFIAKANSYDTFAYVTDTDKDDSVWTVTLNDGASYDGDVGDTIWLQDKGVLALGDYSHAEGYNTIAASDYQHVQGKYNIIDNSNTYAHIIGKGTSSTRSNAYTLDWSGNGVFAGTVTYNGNQQIKNVATLEYEVVDTW